MKKLLFLLLLVSGIASAQYTPTGSKTRFVNGIGLGTKSDAAFGTVDSLVLYASADSTLKFKFKGTARALMYAANVGSQIHDSLYAVYQLKASTSAGARLVSNSGTVVSEWGLGGSANMDFHGFAGYDANRSASYTARSFTDKNYVDSSRALDVQLAGTQTITGAKTFSAILNTGSRLNVNGATDNASYQLNVNGASFLNGTLEGRFANFRGQTGGQMVVTAENTPDNLGVRMGTTTTNLAAIEAYIVSNENPYNLLINPRGGFVTTGSRLNVNGATDNGVDAVNVTGKGLFSDRVQASYFKTNSAVASIASLTPTTIFSAATNGRYEVYAYINGGNATNYAAIATVITEGGTSRIVANNATYLQLTVSGTNVQATHQSGNPSDVYYSYLLITN